MTWLLGPWPMCVSAALWLFMAAAYASRKDWGHTTMSVAYAVATAGLIYAWFNQGGQS